MEDGRRLLLVTLGCAKNLVDSEQVLGLLTERGWRLAGAAADPEGVEAMAAGREPVADVCLVNTCAFVEAAREESVETILLLARLKERGAFGRLVVAGCLAQRYAGDLLAEVPAVDAVVGTGDALRVARAVETAGNGERRDLVGDPTWLAEAALPRRLLTPGATAYLKIAEGCDHRCTFCVIPRLRGPYRSKPPDLVLAEARSLAEAGVRELVLVAQDSSRYGLDLEGRFLLPRLLARLHEVEGIAWIRVLYNHPATFTPDLARAMADLPKVCRYVDVPLQHGSDRLLAAMGRAPGRDRLLAWLDQVRAAMPDAVFRSTFIVGFPGETDADHREMRSFLRRIAFDYVGFFPYSAEEGTPAAGLRGRVRADVTERRLFALRRLQDGISRRRLARFVGRTLEVLVEGEQAGERGFYRGRFRGQAPEVDGGVVLASPVELAPGRIVRALVTHADEADLHATLEDGLADAP